MRTTRYSTSRRKACHHCVAAKAKCDRHPGRCTRCRQRGLSCGYSRGESSPNPESLASSGTAIVDSTPETSVIFSVTPIRPEESHSSSVRTSKSLSGDHLLSTPTTVSSTATPSASEQLDFSGLELICPIRAGEIANRWLNSFFADAGQVVKQYPQTVSLFLYRMMKSFVGFAIRGRGVPPFIHSLQISQPSSLPLTTCLSVIRMCSEPLRGSSEIVTEVLGREMTRLFGQQETCDDMGLLATFQAYLIYAMVIFFRFGAEARTSLQQAAMNLQTLACSVSRRGLMCLEEQRGTRPRWEHWIAAEAKRRTLFAMYLFDSVLLTEDGFPTYLGKELTGLLAPASKALWEAPTRAAWTTEYNIHLTEWPHGHLRIEELWPMADGEEEVSIANRRKRVDLWLEGLDGFGTLIYAVTCPTHGV